MTDFIRTGVPSKFIIPFPPCSYPVYDFVLPIVKMRRPNGLLICLFCPFWED